MQFRFLTSLILFAFFLAACSPATPTAAPAAAPTVEPSIAPSLVPTLQSTPAVDLTATNTLELLSATPPSDIQPVATSRGPDLEATNPSTVSLASGGLQLVEFFRFT